jgi:hypothetical protein
MPSRLDDDKRLLQRCLAIQRQDPFQFRMNGIQGRRQNAKIEHSGPTALDKDQAAVITIASHDDPPLLMSNTQQLSVLGLRQAELGGWNNVVSEAGQKTNGDGIDILIDKELHGVVAKQMSSAATTSMAY